MALVPVQCPGCGASVELEEGQTIAKCMYCGATSVVAAPRPAPKSPTSPAATSPAATSPAATPAATSKGMTRGGCITLAVVALLVVGLFGGIAYTAGVGLDYLEDGPAVRSFLVDEFGEDARFVSMHLQPGYLHVKMIKPDDTVIMQRFDGRSARDPEPDGKADPEELAAAFDLDDVDFDVMEKIADHARKSQPEGTLEFILLGSQLPFQADLLWSAHVKVAGEHVSAYYDLEGNPLVDEPRNFFAPEASWFARLEKKAGPKVRFVQISLMPAMANAEVMVAKSKRDTDRYTLRDDGTIGVPSPATTDGDAAELEKKIFVAGDIDWKALPKAVAHATQEHDGAVSQVIVERSDGELGFTVYVQSKRGNSRMSSYDRQGKRRKGPGD